MAYPETFDEKKYKKKVQKQGAGREIVYRHASDDLKRGLDAARKKEWDNWKGYTNMKKITADQFREMKRNDPNLRVIPTRWVDVDKAEKDAPERKLKSRLVDQAPYDMDPDDLIEDFFLFTWMISFGVGTRWLVQVERGIHVSQREAKATPAEQGQLRSVIGSLNWLVRGGSRLIVEANNLVRYVSRTKDQGLFYPAEAMDLDKVMLLAVQDASYAADYDQSASGDRMGYRSQSGRVLMLAPDDCEKNMKGVVYPISWHSTVIRRVCKSTLQAETLSMQMGALEADHAQDRMKVAWFTDCFSLWSHLHNPTTGSVGDKRLAIDLCAMRQELWRAQGEEIGDPLGNDRPPDGATTVIYWTSTDRMLADGLT
ncbi:TY4B-J, partial [Symbiodinium necroappetens]